MDRGPGVPPPPRHQPVGGSRGSSSGSLGAHGSGADGSSEDLHALGKREKVKDKVKRYIAKLSFVEMSVMKATTKIEGPPKEKHTRRLVLESWSHPDTAPAEMVHALSRINLLNSPVVTLKALSTVHELMQRGSPAVLPAVGGWLDHLSLVQSHWDGNGNNANYGLSEVCSPLVVAYARLLAAKARFHSEHRAFENNYSFDEEAEGRGGGGIRGGGSHPISAPALRGMLSVGRTCREALEHCSKILPANPPLIVIQWQRLVAHVGKLMAVESHLLHGAAVYVAAMLASSGAGGLGTSGLSVEDAAALEGEHSALRGAFERARARPAIVSAFVEEGGDPALPSGWSGEDGTGGRGGFRFLELPATLPSFDTEEGRAAMSSMIASSFGPPSSHLPPLPHEEEEDESFSPFDDCPSDDDVGGESPRVALKIVDVPDLIDLGDFDDDAQPGLGPPAAHFVQEWPSPTRLAPAPPRPPLFAGYGGVSNTPAAPAPHGASLTPVSISGKGPARGAWKEHSRDNSGDKVLDINASLAAFELTATRPPESPKMKLNAREPSVFADIAPAGINSTRPAPPPPLSMNAQRVARPLVNQFAPSPQPQPQPQPQQQSQHMMQQPAMPVPQAPWPVPMQAPRQPEANPPPALQKWNSPPRDWVQWDNAVADAPSVQTPADTPIVHPLNDALVQPDVAGLLGDLTQGSFDEIPIAAIRFGKRVGTGAFGEVLKATYQGTDVAVKRLRLDPNQPQAAEDFRRELRVLCGLRHRHVVQFLGACTTGPDLCLVMDFCGVGSLYGVLHNRRQSITAAHVMRWMADTARGMVYLHSRNIIHRDIKSGNLLLDDSGVIKVADFGLARAHGPTSNLLTLVGTYPYMAPELLDSQPYNSSVDVYSFGVVMWECLTRDEPFRGFSPMQIVATLLRGERPKLPAQPALPASYVSLLTQCWATEPERRPTFEVALERLLEIAHAMKAAESRG